MFSGTDEKPRIRIKKHRSKAFYIFISSFVVTLSLLLTLLFPVFNGKPGIEIIQEMLSNSGGDSISPLGDDPPLDNTSPAYHYWYAPENSFGIQETKTVNETYFKQLFNEHFYKNARYKRYSYSDWTDGTEYLSLNKTWNESGFWKVDIILDIPVDLYSVNVSFGCDLPVLNYIEREGHEIWLNYSANATENYQIMFNWSDIAQIPNLEISKHRQDGKFWISFKRDNVPSGYYVFDPTFGNVGVGSTVSSCTDVIIGVPGTSGATGGIADNITISVDNGWTNGIKVKCALYYGASGSYAYIDTTEERSDGGSGWQIFVFDAPKPTITATTDYAIVVWADSGTVAIDAESGQPANSQWYQSEGYGAWPNPIGSPTSSYEKSIYCSYTEGGANTAPTQSLQKIWNSTTSTEKSLNATGVSLTPTCFNVTIADIDADQTNVTIKTNESDGVTWTIVNQTSSGMSNGTYHGYNTSWVDSHSTKYWISFNVSDDSDWCNETFWFWSYNQTWQVIDDTVNGSFQNTSSWMNVSFVNGSFTNISSLKIVDNSVNGSFQNTSSWMNVSYINGSFTNISSWMNISYINGSFQNTTSWKNVSSINGTFTNTSALNWYTTDDTVNGSFQNTTSWKNISFVNGSFTNISSWMNISYINGSFQNTTSWKNISFVNGSFTNTSAIWNVVDDTINGSFSNTSGVILVTDEFPSNNTYLQSLQPTVYFTLTNPSGRTMKYTIYIGNSSANTTTVLDNDTGVGNGTYHYTNYFTASNYTSYYWRVYANDSTQEINETFTFTCSRAGGGIISSGGSIGIAAAALMFSCFGVIALVFVFSKRRRRDQ